MEPENILEMLRPRFDENERVRLSLGCFFASVVGFKGDRSYAVRGNNIGVFRHSGDQDQDQVKYYAMIGNTAGPKGKKFNPKKVPGLWYRMKHILILRILGHAARLR